MKKGCQMRRYSQLYAVTQNALWHRSDSLSHLQKVTRRSQHARKETEFLRLKRTRLGLDDFESLKVIGRGAFGEVKVSNSVILVIEGLWFNAESSQSSNISDTSGHSQHSHH